MGLRERAHQTKEGSERSRVGMRPRGGDEVGWRGKHADDDAKESDLLADYHGGSDAAGCGEDPAVWHQQQGLDRSGEKDVSFSSLPLSSYRPFDAACLSALLSLQEAHGVLEERYAQALSRIRVLEAENASLRGRQASAIADAVAAEQRRQELSVTVSRVSGEEEGADRRRKSEESMEEKRLEKERERGLRATVERELEQERSRRAEAERRAAGSEQAARERALRISSLEASVESATCTMQSLKEEKTRLLGELSASERDLREKILRVNNQNARALYFQRELEREKVRQQEAAAENVDLRECLRDLRGQLERRERGDERQLENYRKLYVRSEAERSRLKRYLSLYEAELLRRGVAVGPESGSLGTGEEEGEDGEQQEDANERTTTRRDGRRRRRRNAGRARPRASTVGSDRDAGVRGLRALPGTGWRSPNSMARESPLLSFEEEEEEGAEHDGERRDPSGYVENGEVGLVAVPPALPEATQERRNKEGDRSAMERLGDGGDEGPDAWQPEAKERSLGRNVEFLPACRRGREGARKERIRGSSMDSRQRGSRGQGHTRRKERKEGGKKERKKGGKGTGERSSDLMEVLFRREIDLPCPPRGAPNDEKVGGEQRLQERPEEADLSLPTLPSTVAMSDDRPHGTTLFLLKD